MLLCSGAWTRATADTPGDEAARHRAEQKQLRAQLQKLAEEHTRSSGAQREEEKRLQASIDAQALARDELRQLQASAQTAESRLQQARAALKASEAEQQQTLRTLRELAVLFSRSRGADGLTGDAGEQARHTAWLRHAGRQRAELLTRLDAQTRQHTALLEQEQQARRSLSEQENAVREQLRRLDRIATEHRNTIAALQRQQEREGRQQENLQQRLAGLDKLLDALNRRNKSSALDGFGQGSSRLAWPVSGRILQRFGAKTDSTMGPARGTLQALPLGTNVFAVDNGVVAWVGWLPRLGLSVLLDHGANYFSLYAHAEIVLHSVGDTVAAGDALLRSGDSGSPPEPAIYIELRRGRTALNPRRWFRDAP